MGPDLVDDGERVYINKRSTTNVPFSEGSMNFDFKEHEGGSDPSTEASIFGHLQSPAAPVEEFNAEIAEESVTQYVSEKIFSERAPPTLDTEAITISQKTEVQTVYSDVSTIDQFVKEAYIHELANLLLNEVYNYRSDCNSINRVATALPECLKAFSLRFGFSQTTKTHRDIITFIHKHRR